MEPDLIDEPFLPEVPCVRTIVSFAPFRSERGPRKLSEDAEPRSRGSDQLVVSNISMRVQQQVRIAHIHNG